MTNMEKTSTKTTIEVNGIFPDTQESDIFSRENIADFLFKHLDKFGDKIEDIRRAVDYALDDKPGQGGFLIVATRGKVIVGAVVMNNTGMKGYILENILVYIAVHNDFRGKGIGKIIMEYAISTAKGSIALHVEPDNPARHLYEKLGFTSKYLEMRLVK